MKLATGTQEIDIAAAPIILDGAVEEVELGGRRCSSNCPARSLPRGSSTAAAVSRHEMSSILRAWRGPSPRRSPRFSPASPLGIWMSGCASE